MDVFLSNWYGIILILWGIVFEIGGAFMMVVVYRWTQRNGRQMIAAADEALREQPGAVAAAASQPTAIRREQLRRAA